MFIAQTHAVRVEVVHYKHPLNHFRPNVWISVVSLWYLSFWPNPNSLSNAIHTSFNDFKRANIATGCRSWFNGSKDCWQIWICFNAHSVKMNVQKRPSARFATNEIKLIYGFCVVRCRVGWPAPTPSGRVIVTSQDWLN